MNDIVEKRAVKDGLHNIVLEISANEYKKVYDRYSNEIASEILNQHLKNVGDDGKPADIQMQYKNKDNIVRISANIHYLGNHHTADKE